MVVLHKPGQEFDYTDVQSFFATVAKTLLRKHNVFDLLQRAQTLVCHFFSFFFICLVFFQIVETRPGLKQYMK